MSKLGSAASPKIAPSLGDREMWDPSRAILGRASGLAASGATSCGSPQLAPSSINDGYLIPFGTYLRRAAQPQPSSAYWRSSSITEAQERFAHGERGTTALVTTEDGAEVAPGISLAVQSVLPGSETLPHRHAFWHLYIVASGGGRAYIGASGGASDATGECAYQLSMGDILYVSPWTPHRLVNPDPSEPFVLYALQNLPQLASLGTLLREAPSGDIEHVYCALPGAPHSS